MLLPTTSRRHFILGATIACAGAQPASADPRLLLDAAGIARLKARVQSPAWASQWKLFRDAADARMNHPVELPPRGANWWHWYVCPRHGQRLTTGRRTGPWTWEHICPVDHEIIPGDPSLPDRDFDCSAISAIHDGYAVEARDCGLLYQVTGDRRYANRARDILLAYAGRYLDYPLHDKNGRSATGGARITSQTLDESVWLISAAQGADLVRDALSAEDWAALSTKLFLPAARDVILVHRLGIHNIQCWKNSAVGLTGFLLRDDALIRAAIDDPDRGYRAQMAKGVQEDGPWFEGAWGYHFYTLRALWPLTEAARNAGIDLYGEPLKKMFEAPVRFAMPNLVLPAFNDSGETAVRNDLYELAWTRYHDPLYLAALDGADRRNQFALWFGDDQLPVRNASPLQSRNAPASGYAILQRGTSDAATWLCLKYGPHGGGHGHPDKNNFVLYARGRVLFPDPGTRPYGSPLHAGWDRATLAHNTLAVDESSQAPATGECLAFGPDFAMVRAGAIYPGVDFVRTAILLDDNLAVFIDRVTAEASHTFDLALHHPGEWRDLPGGKPFTPPAKDGYRYLETAVTRRVDAPCTLSVDFGGVRTAITLAANEPSDLITATGPGRSTEERIPIAIIRRTGRQATYIWAASLNGTAVQLSLSGMTVSVRRSAKSWTIESDAAGRAVHIAG